MWSFNTLDCCFLTGGSDGELALHHLDESCKLSTTVHRRIHRGAITDISATDAHFISVGEDGALYVTSHNVLESKLTFRATLPLQTVAVDVLIAVAGDELTISVVDFEANVVWKSEILASVISVDAKGLVSVWKPADGGYAKSRSVNIGVSLNGLFILEKDELKMKEHIKPPTAAHFSAAVIPVPGTEVVVLAHSEGATLISSDSLELSPDLPMPVANVIGVAGNALGNMLTISSDGSLAPFSVTFAFDDAPKSKKSSFDMFDSDAEAEEREDEDKILKRDRKYMMDSEEEFDDYDVEDPTDQPEPAIIPPSTMQYRPECIHKQFQPSCTPFVHGYRFLCWNNTGIITSRQDEGYCSVAVEFHDKNFHRPVHFIDEFGYTMGAIGKSGFILASPKDAERPSMLYISPLDSQERSAPWSISLAPEEDALGVAIGAAKYAVVATSAGFLRTFSPTGLQGPIVNFPGSFVSMVAHANQLFVLTSDEFSSELVYTFYSLDKLAQLRTGHVGGRFRNLRLGWIGWSDSGIAGIFDEQMVLHICNADAGYVWQPWLECREHKEKKELVWPIGFTANDLLCLQLRSGDEHPEPVPRPMPTVIPMQIPLLAIDDPTVVSFERAFRAHTIFNSGSLRPELADRESRRLQLASDKHVLELIQLAIRADKPARVIELCPLFLMEKSWDMAIQLVRHNRLAQLADRIENLRNKTECKTEVPCETRVRPALVKTPKALSQVAIESPSTTLANLTPIPFSLEATQLKPDVPLFPLSHSAFDESTQLPPEMPIEPALETPAALANPFAQLSFDTPRTEAKSRSFAEMMRTVQQAVEAPSPIKKARSEAPAEKTKRQSELSLFSKCVDENTAGNE
ncbi:hypothetical protein PSACC_00599 [Paramicrosporidium saccamoebae]|uniref:Uncharacterized protein n=1 Tax=Paramicrosporidium saccamoebae TaxID=1246581 RepID=A0A2H9TPC6_9FUNG|nr:hypothetical protein PSACC_00599 [Paramicrosporidium saccamoebae]